MPIRTKKPAARSAGKSALRWVRLPHQERSQQRLDNIIAAAEKLISRKGFAETSIPEIAKEAGCSVGLIYTRFKDKDDLLRYIIEHFLEETLATGREVLQPANWEGVPFAKMVGLFVKGWVKLHERHEGLFLAFYESVRHDAVLSRRLGEVTTELEKLCYELARARADEISHPDPRTAAAYALRIPSSVMLQHTLLKRVASNGVSMNALAEEITRNLVAYWGVRDA